MCRVSLPEIDEPTEPYASGLRNDISCFIVRFSQFGLEGST